MIYKIGHRISILLNVQRKQKKTKKGVDSKVIRTRRIVKVHDSPPSWTTALIEDSMAG